MAPLANFLSANHVSEDLIPIFSTDPSSVGVARTVTIKRQRAHCIIKSYSEDHCESGLVLISCLTPKSVSLKVKGVIYFYTVGAIIGFIFLRKRETWILREKTKPVHGRPIQSCINSWGLVEMGNLDYALILYLGSFGTTPGMS